MQQWTRLMDACNTTVQGVWPCVKTRALPLDRRRVGTPPLSAWAHQYTEVDDAEQDAEDVRADPEVAAASHGGSIRSRFAKFCVFCWLAGHRLSTTRSKNVSCGINYRAGSCDVIFRERPIRFSTTIRKCTDVYEFDVYKSRDTKMQTETGGEFKLSNRISISKRLVLCLFLCANTTPDRFCVDMIIWWVLVVLPYTVTTTDITPL